MRALSNGFVLYSTDVSDITCKILHVKHYSMKIGVLGHLLLGLLARGERTGWELTNEFDTSLANVWAASHSQIYPELAKLEGGGLIRKTVAGPRGSQRYAITESGRATVTAWLADTQPGDSPRAEHFD